MHPRPPLNPKKEQLLAQDPAVNLVQDPVVGQGQDLADREQAPAVRGQDRADRGQDPADRVQDPADRARDRADRADRADQRLLYHDGPGGQMVGPGQDRAVARGQDPDRGQDPALAQSLLCDGGSGGQMVDRERGRE